jgi:hypothetical protein
MSAYTGYWVEAGTGAIPLLVLSQEKTQTILVVRCALMSAIAAQMACILKRRRMKLELNPDQIRAYELAIKAGVNQDACIHKERLAGTHFNMAPSEAKFARKWCADHDCPKWSWYRFWRERCSYPQFTYSFTQIGIGMVVRVSCHCGASENVTDYSLW